MTRHNQPRKPPRPVAPLPASPAVWAGTWPWLLMLLAVTFAAYGPALTGGFIWDDDADVELNETLRTLFTSRQPFVDRALQPQP